MITIERHIKGKDVIIGWIENIGRKEWIWTCYDAKTQNDYEPYSSGCATSRTDADSEVRKDYRQQIKPPKGD